MTDQTGWTPSDPNGWTPSQPSDSPSAAPTGANPSGERPRPRRGRRLLVVAVAAEALVIAGAGVILGHVAWRPSPSSSLTTPSTTGPSGGSGLPGSGSSGFGSGSSGSGSAASGGPTDAASIAQGVDAGLVDINTTLSYQNEEAAGTGMVLTSNGEVLTNNHVIEGATTISVTDVGNNKTYSATVVGYDRSLDVAVLQLKDASGLQTVSLGDSSSVHVGEAVVGIGNAGGTGGTPSYAGGSVTGLNQSITASDSGDGSSEQLTDLIGTNADIQPGDSGGPLVDTSGKVIGMDTAASAGFQFQQSGSSATQGFAIPINEALSTAKLIEAGSASSTVHIGATAFLGVDVQGSGGSGGFGGGFGVGGTGQGSSTSGAVIVEVVPSSPAAQAGLVAGDTITSLNGASVTSSDSLTTIIQSEKPGTSVPLTYVDSSGQQHTVTVQLASGPPQ